MFDILGVVEGVQVSLAPLGGDGMSLQWPAVTGLVVLAVACMCYAARASPWKERNGPHWVGSQMPERLKVFANWAKQQVEDTSPETHRQMLDDVIYTFATYAQRLQQDPSPVVRRAAVLRLRVLIDLLETPAVNIALRDVNWAWLREWDRGSLDQREARLRCTIIFPTICAAERVQRQERRRWCARRENAPVSMHSLAYLAAWCADFLERSDARDALGLGESTPPGQHQSNLPYSSSVNFIAAGALYSDSSDDEEMSPKLGAFKRHPSQMDSLADGDAEEVNSEFSRRTFDGESNCWDDVDATHALVRGPKYLDDRRKAPSKTAMMELVAADLVKTNDEMIHYAKNSRGRIPGLREAGDKRFYFVINFRLVPLQLALVWAVPSDADWMNEPEGVLFRRYCEMSPEERDQRLKILPKVLEGPWLVKQSVPDRPGVVGKKLQCQHFLREDHLEMSINCISSPAGRRLVQLLTGAAKHFSMELLIILEGQRQDELPERVLGGFSFFHGDLSRLRER
mmetsp:Transcript_104260/g.270266  ORF Transcript_104260/g.270266 Transcript_104260/m.270266 type:complete len:513 (+) Transcript_104260:134-1672(+)